LAEVHRYALIGWPTLLDASKITDVKPATLKARCEKGQLEGYIDLTKRLRLNPAELGKVNLLLRKPGLGGRPCERGKSPALAPRTRFYTGNGRAVADRAKLPQRTAGIRPKFILPPAPEPKIGIIKPEHYGLSGLTGPARPGNQRPEIPTNGKMPPGYLLYDPLRPFSLSVCSPGKTIRYGQHTGTILKILDDPYTPTIKVAFPDHEHPAMREVLLVVDKRKSVTAA